MRRKPELALERITPVPTSTTTTVARNSLSQRISRSLRRLVVFCAFAYPAALLLSCLAFAYVGERWWVTAAALYAPRVLFAAPLPVLVVALLLLRRKELLWTQALAALVTLFPLMGFVLPWPTAVKEGAPSLTLMSFNVNSAHAGTEQVMDQVGSLSPDIVLIQEIPWGQELLEKLQARYPHAEASTQFIIASRYPVLERTEPGKLPHEGRQRSPRFMRYLVQTPIGRLALYSIHPISPRGTLGLHKFRGVLHQVRTGEILAGDPEADVGSNASLRSKQIAAAASMAMTEKYPVMLAGDLNLPGLSATLRQNLGGYADGFASVSWGLGYTFPQKYPFLRLDRILAGSELRFTGFQVGCPGPSDHFCVQASLQRR